MGTDRFSKRKRTSDPASDILPLASELGRIRKEAEALGIFTNDRGLLECSECGLVEDVTSDGRLITYQRTGGVCDDSGLRFEKLNETAFCCPVCSTKLKATLL